MAAVIDDLIQQLHDDAHGALSSDPGFHYVPVYQSRTPLALDGDGNPIVGQGDMIEDQIKAVLAGLESKNSKSGIACVVLLPDVQGESVNSAAPALKLMLKVRVIENRLINETTDGTGIAASKLCLHLLQVLNRRAFRGGNALYADINKMIEEVALPGDVKIHEVHFIQNVMPEPLPKVNDPTVSAAEGVVTLACATSGAAIYYTLDGSFPGSGNTAATLYATPFPLDAGVHHLRAAAEKTAMQASNDLAAAITVS